MTDGIPGGEFITIARVAKTQGRIGEVACDLHTDFPEKFADRKRLFAVSGARSKLRHVQAAGKAQRRELEVENHWFQKGRVVLKFAGVDSISLAEDLVGCEIQIPADERAALEPGGAYVSDLVGCTVFDREREVGVIRDVEFGAGDAPVLVVKGPLGQEFLIPWADEFVERMDLAAREMHMVLPDGLLEINLPAKPGKADKDPPKRSLDGAPGEAK